MDLRAQSAFLAALIAGVLAVAVYLRSTERRPAAVFALLAGNLALWHLSDFLHAATGEDLFLRLMVVSATLLPATAHRFFQTFLSGTTITEAPAPPAPVGRRTERILLACAVAGSVLALTPVITELAAGAAVTAYVFGALAVVLYQVFQRRDATESRVDRVRLTYVVGGAVIALLFAAAGFVPGLSGLFPALGNVVLVVYLYFLSQALLHHRLLDLNELLGRIIVLSGIGIVLVVVYGVIVLAVGDAPALLVFNILLASFVFMTLFEPLRSRLESRVMAWLFAERYDLTRALGRLRRELPGFIDVTTAAMRVLDRLYETNRVTHASVYLLAEDRTGYRLLASRGPEPPFWVDAVHLREIVDAARTGQKAVLKETAERRLAHVRITLPAEAAQGEPAEPEALSELKHMLTVMDRMHAGVTVPLLGAGHVTGILNLKDERVYEAYSTEEIAAIITVADLLGTIVENSRLYEKMKERDRLAVLGEMAAGMAHEIRNPLGAIKAAAQYLDPESLEGDEGEFLQVIIDEVNRLNGVVSQFLDYARPLKSNLVPADVGELIKKTLRLLERQDIPAGVEVRCELAPNLPLVPCDPEQLKQVLINLVLNALQAMDGKGVLTFRTAHLPGAHEIEPGAEGGEGVVEIRVRDTGPGIPEEVRRSLFIPFFTTKDRGTGLGLAISQRIVQSHHGNLLVMSRPGDGAEFVIRLPVKSASAPRPRTEEPLAPVVPLHQSTGAGSQG